MPIVQCKGNDTHKQCLYIYIHEEIFFKARCDGRQQINSVIAAIFHFNILKPETIMANQET